jgi:hypothetical protein
MLLVRCRPQALHGKPIAAYHWHFNWMRCRHVAVRCDDRRGSRRQGSQPSIHCGLSGAASASPLGELGLMHCSFEAACRGAASFEQLRGGE